MPIVAIHEGEDDAIAHGESMQLNRVALERHGHRGHVARDGVVVDLHESAALAERLDRPLRGMEIA